MLTSVKTVVAFLGIEFVFGAIVVGIVALMSTTVAGWVAVVFGALAVLQVMGIALSALLGRLAVKRAGNMLDEMNKSFDTKF